MPDLTGASHVRETSLRKPPAGFHPRQGVVWSQETVALRRWGEKHENFLYKISLQEWNYDRKKITY